ncbi:helicase RepA family protein [Acidithiobacillus sp.]
MQTVTFGGLEIPQLTEILMRAEAERNAAEYAAGEPQRLRRSAAFDLGEVFSSEPTELDFVLPGFLRETPGLIIAPGATGKSFWSLQAAISVASGTKIFGVNATAGDVVYLSAEDPADIVKNRLRAMATYLSPDERMKTAQNCYVIDIRGKRTDIMNEKTREHIVAMCKGARLIIVDTLSRVHGLSENDNGDMAIFISQIESVAVDTGAAVLMCHHVSKNSFSDGRASEQQAARGASALVDNTRFTGYVARMSKEQSNELSMFENGRPIGDDGRNRYVQFGVAKQNYGEPISSCWHQRQKGGVLIPVALHKAKNTNVGVKKSSGKSYADTKNGGYADDDF